MSCWNCCVGVTILSTACYVGRRSCDTHPLRLKNKNKIANIPIYTNNTNNNDLESDCGSDSDSDQT